MPQVFKILSRMTILPAVLACLFSCSRLDEQLDVDSTSGEMQARFSITVPGTSTAASRASSYSSEGYDAGEGYENYIDIDGLDFAFYFFDYNNNFITQLQVLSVVPEESSESSKTYSVCGLVDKSVKNGQVKVVALANWGTDNYPESPASIADFEKPTFSFTTASMNLSRDNKIPLYGVTNPQTLDFKSINGSDTKFADAGTIHMLRAFAKVSVQPKEQTSGIKDSIEYVMLTRHNTQGFCAPKGIYLQNQYVFGDYDLDYVSTPHIPSGYETSELLDFIEKGDGSFIAYVPEYRNIDADGSVRSDGLKARLELKFKDNDKICYVDFCDYSTEAKTPFDILRNNWYRYTVSLTEVDYFTVVLDVVPYTSITLNPDFGLDRDDDGNIIDKNGNKISFDGDGNQIFKDPDGNIFQICDGNSRTIIAKCNIGADSKPVVDRDGTYIYARNGDSAYRLENLPNAGILVQNEYNTFTYDDHEVLDYAASVGVFAVIFDKTTYKCLYKLDSYGSLLQ